MAAFSFVAIVGLVLFLVVPVAVLVVVVVLVARSSRRTASAQGAAEVPVRDAPAAYRRAVRHASGTAWASWALLVAASVVVALVAGSVEGGLPPVAFGAPTAAAGLAFLAACATGELTWPHPGGSLRRAPLAVRTVGTVTPAWLRRLTWAWAALLVVTLTATGLTADPHPGADGYTVTVRFGTEVTSSASPYPGWRYGVPIMVATLVVVAACEAVLRLVAQRPAVADTAPDDDQRLRRVSARRVLAAVQLVLAVTAATVLAITANTLRSVSTATWISVGELSSATTTTVHPGAAAFAAIGGVLAAAVLVTGVVVAVVAVARAAAEAGRPVTPPPAPAGGPAPAGAPS